MIGPDSLIKKQAFSLPIALSSFHSLSPFSFNFSLISPHSPGFKSKNWFLFCKRESKKILQIDGGETTFFQPSSPSFSTFQNEVKI